MYNKHYVGLDLTGFENNGSMRPISRVTLMVDSDNAMTAGDDTGIELVADCPHATQSMVNAILKSVKGYTYKMYSASGANLDPSAELGDGITAGGIYSVISSIDDDGSYPDVAAPGEQEMEDEYPTEGPVTQKFNRKIADTRATITKTADEIRLEVTSAIDGVNAQLALKVGKDENNQIVSMLNASADQINIHGDRFVLDSTNFKVDANGTITATNAKITGTITATSGSFTGKVTATSGSFNGKITAKEGEIGGFTIASSKLYKTLDALGGTSNGVYIGTDGIALGGGKFKVTSAGKLTATDATITGAITATSGSFTGTITAKEGEIGGWTIGDGISYQDDTNRFVIRPKASATSDSVLYIGSKKESGKSYIYKFVVSKNGDVVANSFKAQDPSLTTPTITSGGSWDGGPTLTTPTLTTPGISGGTWGDANGNGKGTLYYPITNHPVLNSGDTGGTSLKWDDGGKISASYGNMTIGTYSCQIDTRAGQSLTISESGGVNIFHGLTTNGLSVTGTKDRVIPTKHFSTRCLSAYETPLPTFSDYGTSALDDTGTACITIDPVFAETVNPDYLPTVFLTPYSDGKLYVDQITHDVITVKGEPHMEFAWETRYVQTNAYVQRLRVMDFDRQDRTGEYDFGGDALVHYEHHSSDLAISAASYLETFNARATDYGTEGAEYYENFERSLSA